MQAELLSFSQRNFLYHQNSFHFRVIWSIGMSRGKCGTTCLEKRCLRFILHFILTYCLQMFKNIHPIWLSLPLVPVYPGWLCRYQHHYHWTVFQLFIHSRINEWNPFWGVPVPVSSQNKWLVNLDTWQLQNYKKLQVQYRVLEDTFASFHPSLPPSIHPTIHPTHPLPLPWP